MKEIKISFSDEEFAELQARKKDASWKAFVSRPKMSLFYEAKTLQIIFVALEAQLSATEDAVERMRVIKALDVVCFDLFSQTYQEHLDCAPRQ